MKLKNKVAFLTAAAGVGIGQAVVRTFAREGARIVVTDAHADRARNVALAIQKEYGTDALGLGCDVTRRNEVELAVKETIVNFGRIDILFNNAGTNRPSQIADMKDEDWELVINVSLRGVFYCCRAVLPIMMDQKYGRIVNTTSVAGFRVLRPVMPIMPQQRLVLWHLHAVSQWRQRLIISLQTRLHRVLFTMSLYHTFIPKRRLRGCTKRFHIPEKALRRTLRTLCCFSFLTKVSTSQDRPYV